MYTRLNLVRLSSSVLLCAADKKEGTSRGGGLGDNVGARCRTGFATPLTAALDCRRRWLESLPESLSLSESSESELLESDEEDDEEEEDEEDEDELDDDEADAWSRSILDVEAALAVSSSELESSPDEEDEDEVGEYDTCLLLRFRAGLVALGVLAGAMMWVMCGVVD